MGHGRWRQALSHREAGAPLNGARLPLTSAEFSMFPARLFAFVFLLLTLAFPGAASAQIYADVTVAGGVNGTFTIQLEHTKAPATVANFIGLATGRKGWLDMTTGAIRYTPFYNGVIFHRVISGFVNQAGSRNGLGTDGPGYRFRDEIDPTLLHDALYVVSMANSGRSTNGSQFFVTAGPASHLNGIHTVFGRVTAGREVSDQINATPVTNQRPNIPITIQSISVYGPSLEGFNLEHPLLPKVFNARPVLKRNGAAFALSADRLPYSDYFLFDSIDLTTWALRSQNYFHQTAPLTDFDVTSLATGPQHFYRLARVDYSTAYLPLVPLSVGGKSFTFNVTSTTTGSSLNNSAVINASANGGTWTLQGGASGPLAAVTYTLDPYTPQLYLRWNSTANYGFDVEFIYSLNYTSSTGGTLTGRSNVNNFQNVTGTFTSSP